MFLRGKSPKLFIAAVAGVIAITIYPIIIDPMINTEKYSKYSGFLYIFLIIKCYFAEKIQEQTRANVKQEEIQPGSNKLLF